MGACGSSPRQSSMSQLAEKMPDLDSEACGHIDHETIPSQESIKVVDADGTEREVIEEAPHVTAVADFAATVIPAKSNQDRFNMTPQFMPSLFMVGVFDGHGKSCLDIEVSEEAAKLMPDLVRAQVKAWKAETGKEDITVEDEKQMEAIFSKAFKAYQHSITEQYRQRIVKPLQISPEQEKKNAKKKNQKGKTQKNFKVPPRLRGRTQEHVESTLTYGRNKLDPTVKLPMSGGCTATVALVSEFSMAVAAVGDSRAILGTSEVAGGGAANKLTAKPMSVDHDMQNDKEKARAVANGGGDAGVYIAVDHADGLIQTLRSLGDVPFHDHEIVTHVPEVHGKKVEATDAFLVLASDGIWQAYENDELVEAVYKQLIDREYHSHFDETHPTGFDQGDSGVVLDVVKSIAAEAKKRATERRLADDDISIAILTLEPFWLAHKPFVRKDSEESKS